MKSVGWSEQVRFHLRLAVGRIQLSETGPAGAIDGLPASMAGVALNRQWILGPDALVLVCHRMGITVARSGQFRAVPAAGTLQSQLAYQCRDRWLNMRTRLGRLAAATETELEDLVHELRTHGPPPG